MAVTAFKYFKNFGNLPVTIRNHRENHTYADIPPGESRSMDEWVPWCFGPGDFDNNQYIEVRQIRANAEDLVYAIWQREVGGNDLVRFSTSSEQPAWADPGTGVPGVSAVNGNRVLFWQPDDTLLVERSGG
jgi:hypothetical protein